MRLDFHNLLLYLRFHPVFRFGVLENGEPFLLNNFHLLLFAKKQTATTNL